MGMILLIMGNVNLLAATLGNYFYTKLSIIKYKVIFIGRGQSLHFLESSQDNEDAHFFYRLDT